MFDHDLLPEALRVSAYTRGDGNDGAHQGTLTKEDANDLLDFTTPLLERLYTEPERLRLPRETREKRRASAWTRRRSRARVHEPCTTARGAAGQVLVRRRAPRRRPTGAWGAPRGTAKAPAPASSRRPLPQPVGRPAGPGGSATRTTSGGGRPCLGKPTRPRHRDVASQTRTPAAPGAGGTAHTMLAHLPASTGRRTGRIGADGASWRRHDGGAGLGWAGLGSASGRVTRSYARLIAPVLLTRGPAGRPAHPGARDGRGSGAVARAEQPALPDMTLSPGPGAQATAEVRAEHPGGRRPLAASRLRFDLSRAL